MAIWRRGYRYLHPGAGHACQNLYLGAGSVDCCVRAIATFSDDDMNDLLLLASGDVMSEIKKQLEKKVICGDGYQPAELGHTQARTFKYLKSTQRWFRGSDKISK